VRWLHIQYIFTHSLFLSPSLSVSHSDTRIHTHPPSPPPPHTHAHTLSLTHLAQIRVGVIVQKRVGDCKLNDPAENNVEDGKGPACFFLFCFIFGGGVLCVCVILYDRVVYACTHIYILYIPSTYMYMHHHPPLHPYIYIFYICIDASCNTHPMLEQARAPVQERRGGRSS
jgi:hypothetical protein